MILMRLEISMVKMRPILCMVLRSFIYRCAKKCILQLVTSLFALKKMLLSLIQLKLLPFHHVLMKIICFEKVIPKRNIGKWNWNPRNTQLPVWNKKKNINVNDYSLSMRQMKSEKYKISIVFLHTIHHDHFS